MELYQSKSGANFKKYRPLCTFQVVGDNFRYAAKSQSVFLYKDQVFTVWNKQKDLIDPDCEHWGTGDGWLLKIEKHDLANLVEVNEL